MRQLDRSDFSDSRGDSKLFNHEDATNIQMRGEENHAKMGERNERQVRGIEKGERMKEGLMIESLLIELLEKPNEKTVLFSRSLSRSTRNSLGSLF